MARYRKKPVVVEVQQFWPDKVPWPDGVCRNVVSSTGFAIHRLRNEQ